MKKKIDAILKKVLKDVKPPPEDVKKIHEKLREFRSKAEKEIKSRKLDAKIFVGGSVAKKTLTRMEEPYEADVFIVFGRKYGNKDVSRITGKIMEKIFKGTEFLKIHGSRDYYVVKFPDLCLEIVPVIKIRKPEEADNVTDLSIRHVSYVKKKMKSGRLPEDVMLLKTFCRANRCYGAESYVRGFSGYGLELLIRHYGSFLKFIKSVAESKNGKIVIDSERRYGRKNDVFTELNASKLNSPIILIDPTCRQRNALAGLSEETFGKFRKACRQFLKNPSEKFFIFREMNFEKMRTRHANNFVHLELKTGKQEGDVAGSKLLKFHRYVEREIKKSFDVKKEGFEYVRGKTADSFFVALKKEEILITGPETKDGKNLESFRKKHGDAFVSKGRIFARRKQKENVLKFLEKWKKENAGTMKEMSVTGIKLS